jgi:O-antigen/teichoic acid export membrane protein
LGVIAKQSISGSILSYIGAAIAFLNVYIQPHFISASDIGLVRLLFSFSFMISTLIPLGIGNIVLRYFPQVKHEPSRHNGFFGLILLVTALGAIIITVLLFLKRDFFYDYYKRSPDFTTYYVEAIITGYIIALNMVLTIYSNALLKTTFSAFLNDVFIRAGQFALIFFYAFGWVDRNGFVLANLGLFYIQLLLLIAYLVKLKSITFKINWKFFHSLEKKEMIFFALLMTFTSFASLGMKFIDQLMIGHFFSEKQVGIYATCIMICVVIEIPLRSLERIAQPKLATAWMNNNQREITDLYEKSSRYMFFIGAVIFCLLYASVDLIFSFLPSEYGVGKTAFYIVSITSLINLLTGLNSAIVLLSNKYYILSLGLFLLMGVSLLTNNVFIPYLGITGAALALLVSFGTFNLLMYLYTLIRFRMQPFSIHTLYIFVTVLVCVAFSIFLPHGLNPFIRAIIGGFFVAFIFLIVNIRYNTIAEINTMLRKVGVLRK